MLTVLFLLACGAEPASAPVAGASAPAAPVAAGSSRLIDVGALKADLDAGKVPVLVDVRTPGEFSGGHVPGAINIPVDQLGGRLGELESYKGREVYLICEVGGRSAGAARSMKKSGWTVVDVGGGTAAWRGAGFPTE